MSLSSASSARRGGAAAALGRRGAERRRGEFGRQPLEQRARAHRLDQPAVEAAERRLRRRRAARTARTAPGFAARRRRAPRAASRVGRLARPSAQSTMTRSGARRLGERREALLERRRRAPPSRPLPRAGPRSTAPRTANWRRSAPDARRARCSAVAIADRLVLGRRQGDAKAKIEPPPGLSASVDRAAHQRDEALGRWRGRARRPRAARVGAVALLEILEDRGAPIRPARRARCR